MDIGKKNATHYGVGKSYSKNFNWKSSYVLVRRRRLIFNGKLFALKFFTESSTGQLKAARSISFQLKFLLRTLAVLFEFPTPHIHPTTHPPTPLKLSTELSANDATFHRVFGPICSGQTGHSIAGKFTPGIFNIEFA